METSSMDIQLTARNLEVTPHLQEYVEKKISKLDRYLPSINEARVDLRVENTRSNSHSQIAQLTIWIGKTVLRSEERDSDMFSAIDEAVDKMQRQISRFNKRRRNRRQRAEQEILPEIEETDEIEIARVKRFDVEPMSPEEAIDQMELLGHQFYVFQDEDGVLSVVYGRKDGKYGLLVPQME
jgi:putative sigma-54 modulation protein